jgi:LmbE family N-acetylglucosaminyl deacetylase
MADVMVVAVHPDDETLGCGGTLLRHIAHGDNIHLCIVTAMYNNDTNGDISTIGSDGKEYQLPEYYNCGHQNIYFEKKDVKIKANEISKVINNYGFTSVHELKIPTTTVSLQDESILVSKVSSLLLQVLPNILYIPFFQDVHGDHRAIFPVLNSCIKTFRYPFIEKVYMMETISETEYALPIPGNSFIPNYFVCVNEWIEQKISIMANYKSEIQNPPFPRSVEMIRAQCQFRGAMAHCNYAEAFMLLKEIVR